MSLAESLKSVDSTSVFLPVLTKRSLAQGDGDEQEGR